MIAIKKSEFYQGFPIVCCLCDKIIRGIHDRHNAQPVINSWCCSDCNMKIVLPYRLRMLTQNINT